MIFRLLLAALCVVCFAVNAEARQRHKTYVADPGCNVIFPCAGVVASPRGEYIAKSGFGTAQKVYAPRQPISATVVAHPNGCPSRAFCGCGAAVRVFGSPIRALWVAANWFKFPRTAPASGMVAVRKNHVFVLEAHLGGDTWRVYDANSGGHATRIHSRSIAGYAIVNPHGAA